ncbi:MAG: KEOPS complex subunit Cgi121 [Candidatus Thorarchaeota archaeon]
MNEENYLLKIYQLKSKEKIERKNLLDLIQSIQKMNGIIGVQSFNSRVVINENQIRNAAWHALIGYKSDKMIAKTLSLEILLFISCQRQINKVFELVGLPMTFNEAGLIIISNFSLNGYKEKEKEIDTIFVNTGFTLSDFSNKERKYDIKLIKETYEITDEEQLYDISKIEKIIHSKIALLRINNY